MGNREKFAYVIRLARWRLQCRHSDGHERINNVVWCGVVQRTFDICFVWSRLVTSSS